MGSWVEGAQPGQAQAEGMGVTDDTAEKSGGRVGGREKGHRLAGWGAVPSPESGARAPLSPTCS